MYLVYPAAPILHNRYCFQFLLCITVVLREIGGNGCTKYEGVNKVLYGLYGNVNNRILADVIVLLISIRRPKA